MSMKNKQTPAAPGACPDYVKTLSLLLFGLWAGLCLFLPWQWSILMDEATFLHSLTEGSFLTVLREQFALYWSAGRFYPVKMLVNIAEWRLLPLNPSLFHAFHFLLICGALGLGWRAMNRRGPGREQKFALGWLPFFFASALLAKPLLDGALHLSIGEGWATLFFAAGLLWFLGERPFLARAAWILAAWSKEPMAGVFLCAALYQGITWERGAPAGKKLWLAADLAIFAGLALLTSYAMRQGTYLAGYSLVSAAVFKTWAYSLARLGFFLLPLALFAALGFARDGAYRKAFLRDRRELAWALFHLSFLLGYLWLVAPRGSGGYLQVPAALAALLLLFPFAARGLAGLRAGKATTALVIFWAALALFSVSKWVAYAQGINDVSQVFPQYLVTENPRLLLVHGPEMADILRAEVKRQRLDRVRVEEASEFDEKKHEAFRGEVILLQPWKYFDPLPETLVRERGRWAGGWKNVRATPSFGIFFGVRNLP